MLSYLFCFSKIQRKIKFLDFRQVELGILIIFHRKSIICKSTNSWLLEKVDNGLKKNENMQFFGQIDEKPDSL